LAGEEARLRRNGAVVMTIGTVLRIAGIAAVATLVGALALSIRPDLDPADLEARYAQAPSRFVTVDGVRFHIRDRGQGPAVVLIHGQSANLYGWEAWAEDLSADHRVISLDLPGHGLTGPDPQARYGWPDMAGLVHGLVTELGNSLGGAISLSYALEHGDGLAGLVLLDAIGSPRDEPKPLIFEAYATPVLGQAIVLMTPEWLVRQSLESSYGDPALVSDADVELFADMMRRAGNREAGRQVISHEPDGQIIARIGEVDMPALVLWGGRDSWTLPKYAHWFHDHLPDARLVMLDDLGHMPMAEDPAATLVPMRAFLAEIGW
jgi:pimeloyl-ACP methyl ester carboxylesterase